MADNQSLAEYLQRRDQFIPPGEVYGKVGRYAAPGLTNQPDLPRHLMPYPGYLDPVMASTKGYVPSARETGYTLNTNDPLANLLAVIERVTGTGNMGKNSSPSGTQLINYWSLPRAMRNPEPLPQFDPNNGILPGPRD